MHKNGRNSKHWFVTGWILVFVFFLTGCASGQIPDRSYRPLIAEPAFAQGEGPLMCLDEAHNNFHTLENRFWAFGELLSQDSYKQ